ncbi:hypothetical protein BH24CHL5_BH24CHL5_01440 [soil metagenome]
MANNLIAGLVAGAAGTVAINVTTYLDMLVRARSSSTMPAKMAGRLADEFGLPLDFDEEPGDAEGDADDEEDETSDRVANRHEALGALLGYVNGLGIGLAYGLVRSVLPRPPSWLAGVALGSLAMAAADYPATKMELTDPAEWSGADWMADVVPHMAYGLVTALAFEKIKK